MSARPWYAFYPADYERDTGDLSLLEHGAYRRLMDHYYSTAEPLPTDVERAFRLCRAFLPDERKAVTMVLNRFFQPGEDGWHHRRIDRELAKTADILEKASRAGHASAAARQRPLNARSNARSTGVTTTVGKKPNGSSTQGATRSQPSQSPSQSQYSEAKASAGEGANPKPGQSEPPEIEPDADDKTWLFSKATHFLAMTYDREPGTFRSQIGKWLKDAGEDATKLRSIIEQAELNRVADPRAWITKAIQNTVKPAAPQSAEVSEHEFWRIKVAQYAKSKSKFWATIVDGPPPDQHPNNIPLDILEEYGFTPPKREGKSAPIA